MQQDRASILWTTSWAGNGRVVVASPDGGTRAIPATMRTFTPVLTRLAATFYQYRADVIGLDPGTPYTYQISVDGVPFYSGNGGFRTASPGAFSFLVFGDSGQNTPEESALVSLMAAERDVSLLLHTGDLVYPQGSFATYDSNYFGLNASLFRRLPVFPTPGNHDYLGDSALAYLASHAPPVNGVDPEDAGRYYSFDWGDAHFTCVDSNLMQSASADRMMDWLDSDLGATRRFWKIVFLHHPPYPTGHHSGDGISAAVRATVNPIVERHGVQLVLAGHEHGYERTAPLADDNQTDAGLGTVYVTSGGGGADLHDVNCGGLTEVAVEAYHYLRIEVDGGKLTLGATALDGRELDRLVIQPKPAISPRGVVSTGDYAAALGRGSLVSIFGQNLAVTEASASGLPLPLDLGGVRVRLDGQDIPLLYASPSQVNAQLPYGASANAMLEVLSANGSDQLGIVILPTAPSILAVTTREVLATAANAPSAGAAVVVYGTGLGQCTQATTAGIAVPGPARAVSPVQVWLGEQAIEPMYAGLTPGFAGVYQVNFTVPLGTAPGIYSLRIATPDASSRSVPLPVQ